MINERFFRRRVFGRASRGCRVDPQTKQSVQFAKHSGDIVYELRGESAVTRESEYRELTKERLTAPVLNINLNEVGENSRLIKRVQRNRHITLD